MAGIFTRQASKALELAREAASELGYGYIGSEHLLIGLVREEEGLAGKVLRQEGVTDEALLEMIRRMEVEAGHTVTVPEMSPKSKRIVDNASNEALRFGTLEIGTEHLLISILKERDSLAVRLIIMAGGNPQMIFTSIMQAAHISPKEQTADEKQRDRSSSALEQYGRDFTRMAREEAFDPIIGREKEIQRIIQILSRRTKNNPCLIGEPGVGKTAIVEGLAARISSGRVPQTLSGRRLICLDMASMIAGTKYRGEFEERMKKVLSEVREGGNVILFMDEIHTLIGAGAAEGAMDASNMIKPALSRGELQLIGATTVEEYRRHIEKDAALERRFQPVLVDEPSEEESVKILNGLRDTYAAYHHVQYTDESLKAAVQLSKRYITDRFLPDAAIDVMDEAGAKIRLQASGEPDREQGQPSPEVRLKHLRKLKEMAVVSGNLPMAKEFSEEEKQLSERIGERQQDAPPTPVQEPVVDGTVMAAVVSEWTGIPVTRLTEEEGEKLKNLEAVLTRRVIGQSEAVSAVAKAVRRGRIGMKDPKRPVGSFLFLGPTGVGKTELSKALAEALFGDEEALIRVDMSEYMEKHSVSKMIGSPPGYVGYEEGGQLSERIRRKPYSVVLFDEIEKAHPDVFHILLQMLDDGRITDSQGRTVDFKNTVLIMTSNVGARNIIAPKDLGFVPARDQAADYQRMKTGVMDEVRRLFRPEFLNRIDEIMVFHTLGETEILQIVGLLFSQIETRVRETFEISLELSEQAASCLARAGYDPAYGARPLRRTLQTGIEDVLADKILNGEFQSGDRVLIDADKDQLVFLKQ